MKSPLKKDYILVLCQAQVGLRADSFWALTVAALILMAAIESQI